MEFAREFTPNKKNWGSLAFREYKHSLISRLSVYASFWKVRTFLIRLRFSFTRIVFQLKIKLSEARFETSIFRFLISTNITFSIIAILMGLFVLFVSNRFFAVSEQIAFSLNDLIGVIPPESTTAYDGSLIGIVTVIGIFLTLYLTNINTAVGTVYAKFPNNIRRLYARERVGNLYIRYLIFLLLLCLVFLGAAVVFNLRSKLEMVLTVLLSLVAIHPFLSLGTRSFELFDPTSLATNFFMEFIEWSQRASENRYWAFDRSFQYHFYKQAESSLNGISTLIKISWDETYLREQPFMSLLRDIPRLFNNYLHQKRRIPTKSLWFLQKAKYDYWYLSSSHAVEIAARTQTDIIPKTEFDTRWVEILLFQSERESLSKCLANERHYDVATIMDYLNTMVSKLGREWDVEYACTELIAIKNELSTFHP